MRIRLSLLFLLIAFLTIAAASGPAPEYLNETRTLVGPPQSTTERFLFTLSEGDPYPHFELAIHMSEGRADVRIVDPAGRVLEMLGAGDCTLAPAPIQRAGAPGRYTVEVTTTRAVGRWRVHICGGAAPRKASRGPAMASTVAMLAVVITAVVLCRGLTAASWRWFWAGAGLWTVAVIVKFAIAIPLNGPLLKFLESALPRWTYLLTATIYGGALTGLTEVLFTYWAARRWPSLAADWRRAAAVGTGAGAFEALLLAPLGILALLIAGSGITSWALMAAPAVERVTAVLCHVAARMLALLAVARRRWSYFIVGFVLLSGIDAVATLLSVSGQIAKWSPWQMEAALAPFGLFGLGLIVWCARCWPQTDVGSLKGIPGTARRSEIVDGAPAQE